MTTLTHLYSRLGSRVGRMYGAFYSARVLMNADIILVVPRYLALRPQQLMLKW